MKHVYVVAISLLSLLSIPVQAATATTSLDQMTSGTTARTEYYNFLNEDFSRQVQQKSSPVTQIGSAKYQSSNDSCGVTYAMQLVPNVTISNEFSLGLQSISDWEAFEAAVNKQRDNTLSDSLKQTQTSKVFYQPSNNLKFTVYNTIAMDMQEDLYTPQETMAGDTQSFMQYGGMADWTLVPGTTFTPQVWQNSSWGGEYDSMSQKAALVSIRQELFKQYLALVVTPSYLWQTDNWSGYNKTQAQQALDLCLRLQLTPKATLSFGNRTESYSGMFDTYDEVSAKSYYLEWQQQASPSWSFRIRSEMVMGEYALATGYNVGSYQENSMKFILGQKYAISNTLTANAELQYITQRSLDQAVPSNTDEKFISVSFKQNF